MTTAELAPPTAPAACPPVERRKTWTTAEYERLVELGFVDESTRAYLWEGEIYQPMTINPAHRNAVGNLVDLLKARFQRAAWTVDQDASLDQEDGTKPEPDVMVLFGPRASYRHRKITVADVVLLVEVSDTTYDRDRGVRLRKNAQTGVPLYWVVNILERRVEVYTNPGVGPDNASSYLNRTDYGLGSVIPLRVNRAGVETVFEGIPVDEILVDSLEPDEGRQAP
jgi:Uma2 family endonuclease